ncbi:hypothetical protein HY633_04570 [Candidatus Uhrbacteria bacterium]|nr:hypothetical protein [Candidatus Uhrbacteria bacterium]
MSVAYARKSQAASQPGFLRPGAVLALNIAFLVFTLMLFVAYLAMNSRSAANGFVIKSMERQVAELRDQQEKLNIEAASSRSMEEIERRVGELGLVPVTSVEYVNVGQSAVAIK